MEQRKIKIAVQSTEMISLEKRIKLTFVGYIDTANLSIADHDEIFEWLRAVEIYVPIGGFEAEIGALDQARDAALVKTQREELTRLKQHNAQLQQDLRQLQLELNRSSTR